jgi:hypothetical protein
MPIHVTTTTTQTLSNKSFSGPSRFDGNVTIFGDLSCNGTQTFQNTIFSTTSAVSVVHTGIGPALWVGNNGTGDIASFYDIDQNVEILHVGGNNGTFPNVGVKTSTPNVDFTVSGAISASSIIYDAAGNSSNWNSAYTTINAQSAVNASVYSSFNSQSAANASVYSSVNTQSANWNSVYSTVQTSSGSWGGGGGGGTIDTGVRALTSNWQDTYTAFSTQSANNISVYSTTNSNSANWNAAYSATVTPITAWTVVSTVTASATTQMPLDNTIPLSNEGTELLVLSGVSPRFASSKLVAHISIPVFYTSAILNIQYALFLDNALDAVSTGTTRSLAANGAIPFSQTLIFDSWSGSKILKFRIGPGTAGTLFIGRSNTGNLFGSSRSPMSMTVFEIPQ